MADKLFPTDYAEITSTISTDFTPVYREGEELYKIKTESLKGADGNPGPQGPAGADGADGVSCNWKGQWLTSTAYALQDIVYQLGSSYVCVVPHTSGTFATDLSAGKWELCAQKGADGTGSGDISGSGTANEIAYFTAEKTIDNLPVATYPSLTELSYVKGVTSSIQTQLNSKQATGSYEVTTNKETSTLDTSTTKYPCNNVVKTAVEGKVPTSRQLTINGTAYDLSTDRSWTISAGGTYWTAVPGSPTRTGNTTFTLTDTSNTNKYDLLISRGTVIKWTESSTVKQAMVVSATYATNTVTVTLEGDTMASIDASSLKYGAVKARELTFSYLPTVGTGTDIMGRWFAGEKTKVHGAIAYHGTAGTTNATTYDINKNGTTIFTTKLSVASGATVGSDTTADSTSYLDTNDYLTVDCDSVSTTAPVYATIKVFVSPYNDIYLA